MKKITLLSTLFFTLLGFAQQKTTGDMVLSPNNGITANFTLDNATSKVALVLKGPADRWFGLGIGVNQGFSMSDGDAVVYSDVTSPKLTDRHFTGTMQPPLDASQDWTIISNTVVGSIRTLVLSRNLTNSDSNDFQMPYATTNSISVAGPRPPTPTTTVAPHGGTANVGYATANFTTLGVEDFSLNASEVFPNPCSGVFKVVTKTPLKTINIYSQVGAFVRSVDVTASSSQTEVTVEGLQTGIYLIELQNDTEKSWKKLIVQ